MTFWDGNSITVSWFNWIPWSGLISVQRKCCDKSIDSVVQWNLFMYL